MAIDENMFCAFCGTMLDKGARFCKSCGKGVYSSVGRENPTERKTVYEGYIHKCPNCGEVLDSFAGNCPSCGFEIRNTASSNAIRDFTYSLQNAKTFADKVEIISSFPVPNTKEDLFEFVVLSTSNIDVAILGKEVPNNDPRKIICKAWLNKLEQVYNKSLIVMNADDKRFVKIKSLYEQIQYQLRMKKVTERREYKFSVIIGMSGSIAAVLLYFIAIIVALTGDESMDSSRANFILLISLIILIVSAVLSGKKNSEPKAPFIAMMTSVLFIALGVMLPSISDTSMNSSRSALTLLASTISLIISIIGLVKLITRKKH